VCSVDKAVSAERRVCSAERVEDTVLAACLDNLAERVEDTVLAACLDNKGVGVGGVAAAEDGLDSKGVVDKRVVAAVAAVAVGWGSSAAVCVYVAALVVLKGALDGSVLLALGVAALCVEVLKVAKVVYPALPKREAQASSLVVVRVFFAILQMIHAERSVYRYSPVRSL